MKKWILKAIVQKTISYLPYRNKINYFFQKHVTKGVYLSQIYFEDRLSHASDHMGWYEKYVKPLKGAKTFELGCGWYPVVPLSMYLKGASKIYSIDISQLMNKGTLKITLERLIQYQEQGRLEKYYQVIPDRMEQLQEIYGDYDQLKYADILQRLNFTYLVEDLTQLKSVPASSIDLTHSNNTFEHVYPEVLKGILKKFIEIGKKKKGCHSHFVDMSDHFAHFDQSITIYNFLKYTTKTWSRIDNDIQPQNRWRLSDYKKMYKELGIPMNEVTFRKGSQEDLAKVDISDEYNGYSKEDLAVSHCHIYTIIQ